MTNMKSIEQYHQIKTKHIMKQLENIETIKNEDGPLHRRQENIGEGAPAADGVPCS